jgi:hypothetical protein
MQNNAFVGTSINRKCDPSGTSLYDPPHVSSQAKFHSVVIFVFTVAKYNIKNVNVWDWKIGFMNCM